MTTTRRVFAAWIAGAFLLLGLPVTASAAAASATTAPQLQRHQGIGDTAGVRAERQSAPRLARTVEALRLLHWPSDLDHHAADVPAAAPLRGSALGGPALRAPATSPDSVPGAVARGRGPPLPTSASAGPNAFLGRPDVSGA